MSGKAALPGLVAGALGLAAGMVGLGLGLPGLGAVAGLLALAAGIASVRLARQLEEQGAVQSLIEEELRTVRTEARKAESAPGDPAGGDDARSTDGEQNGQLTDESTGLFSESFFMIALDSRIAAARRHLRPVSVVLLDVVEGLPGNDPKPTEAVHVAEAIDTTLREADTACRLENGIFALLLEDTPENGAIWTVERIRRFLSEKEPELTMWAGVACYPAHAFGAPEIMTAAEGALVSAREWRQDRIEVALVASD